MRNCSYKSCKRVFLCSPGNTRRVHTLGYEESYFSCPCFWIISHNGYAHKENTFAVNKEDNTLYYVLCILQYIYNMSNNYPPTRHIPLHLAHVVRVNINSNHFLYSLETFVLSWDSHLFQAAILDWCIVQIF